MPHSSTISHATCPARTPLMKRLAQLATRRFALARSRAALAQLDDNRLADIGVTRSEAEAEAARSLWDAPSHWAK